MAATTLSGPLTVTNGVVGNVTGTVTGGVTASNGAKGVVSLLVPITIVDGAAAGTFTVPAGAIVLMATTATEVAIPGTPTNTNLRLGSSANGQQYVADVDVKAAGGLNLTLVAAARLAAAAGTWHYTVASSGGTAADQDGTVNLYITYRT